MVQVNITKLIDEVQCYQTVRELRWPDGIACPSCESKHIIKRGFDDTEPARQRSECHGPRSWSQPLSPMRSGVRMLCWVQDSMRSALSRGSSWRGRRVCCPAPTGPGVAKVEILAK